MWLGDKMDKDVKMTIASTSARRQKTDLHINEPILTRSSSPSPKLAPRVQRTQQYRYMLMLNVFKCLEIVLHM